jgi:D-alanyl-D-alanine carboxypeptidase
MMNQKAQELGCTNTHFANASGLPDENHYTTAYDMAKIMQAGLLNDTFREIVGTVTHKIPATNLSKKRTFHTHLPLLASESDLYYEGCLGGKTGYTSAAQHTLVVAAEREDCTLIAVTLQAQELGWNCEDSIALFDYGFENFTHREIDGQVTTLPVTAVVEETAPTETPVPTASSTPTKTPASGESEASQAADSLNGEITQAADPALAEQETGELSETTKMLLVVMGCMIVILIILLAALFAKGRKRKNRKKKRVK